MSTTPATTTTQSNGITALHRDPAAAVLAAAHAAANGAVETQTAVSEIVAAAGAEATAAVVREAQARLLTSLARNPFFDPAGVRASRLLFAAADVLRPAPEAALAVAA